MYEYDTTLRKSIFFSLNLLLVKNEANFAFPRRSTKFISSFSLSPFPFCSFRTSILRLPRRHFLVPVGGADRPDVILKPPSFISDIKIGKIGGGSNEQEGSFAALFAKRNRSPLV